MQEKWENDYGKETLCKNYCKPPEERQSRELRLQIELEKL